MERLNSITRQPHYHLHNMCIWSLTVQFIIEVQSGGNQTCLILTYAQRLCRYFPLTERIFLRFFCFLYISTAKCYFFMNSLHFTATTDKTLHLTENVQSYKMLHNPQNTKTKTLFSSLNHWQWQFTELLVEQGRQKTADSIIFVDAARQYVPPTRVGGRMRSYIWYITYIH